MRCREYHRVFDELDLPVVNTTVAGSGHMKITTQYRGEQHYFVCSTSRAEYRAVQNFKADVKRWKRAVDEGGTLA